MMASLHNQHPDRSTNKEEQDIDRQKIMKADNSDYLIIITLNDETGIM